MCYSICFKNSWAVDDPEVCTDRNLGSKQGAWLGPHLPLPYFTLVGFRTRSIVAGLIAKSLSLTSALRAPCYFSKNESHPGLRSLASSSIVDLCQTTAALALPET